MFSLVSFKACLTISHPGFQTHLLLIHSEASAPSLADCCSTVLHSQGRVLLVSQCHSWGNPPCLSQVFTPMKIWLTPYAGRRPDGPGSPGHMPSTPGTSVNLQHFIINTQHLLMDPGTCHLSSQRARDTSQDLMSLNTKALRGGCSWHWHHAAECFNTFWH